ncbi:MAG: M42 family metallopeptidase [Candidatus Cloacimonetes bacterium]|nr:M42 family metallopeptidase [Candidatus Cloacimonadota bacterium]
MESLELLKKLTLASGISGHETEIAKIMKQELAGTVDSNMDRMGSISFRFEGKCPKILFIAHQDEIGFIVGDIMESGFIKIQPIGGWDPNTLLSSPVKIINRNGEEHDGIIGSVPVHFQQNGNGKPNIASMFVDVGAQSKQDLIENFGINLGDQIVPITNFHYSKQNKRILSKAFDDRVGIASVIEVAKFTSEIEHPNTVICTGSVQEEIGGRGAASIAQHTDADICIVLEGAPADDIPGIPGNSQTGIGHGAHVRLFDPTMMVKKGLADFIVNTANKYDISIQTTIRKGGGTDGAKLHYANYGIPTIVLGTPVRYAHSHNCLMSLTDYENLMKLLEKIVTDLDENAYNEIIK